MGRHYYLNTDKKHNVMRFNATLKVDFSEWTQVKMERENNMKEYRGVEEEMPKFGAGSEFGRDAREEARRKKFGITSRKYKPEDQPWILKAGGRTGKKFKGTREGGVSENAAYYVFTHAPDGAIEAFPLHEWYNFQVIQRYKALSAEEAEQEFSRRNQVMNYWSLMCRKRLRNDEDGGDDDGELAEAGRKAGKKPTKKEKELKISEMDEWMESDDDDDDSDSDADKEKKKAAASDEEINTKKKKGKNVPAKKKKKKNASDDEAFEESDDGDEEGRECEYISDSTDMESENEQHSTVKSVAEEDALRKLLASDEDDDDEEQNEKKEGEDDGSSDAEAKDKDDKENDKSTKDADKKTKEKKKKKKQSKKKDMKKASPTKDSSSDFSSDSGSDSDIATKEKENNRKPNSAHSSRSATPTPITGSAAVNDQHKRKLTSSPDLSQSKKLKLDNFNLVPSTSYIPGSSESGITEDAVRRYLMRKPMTTTELLQKFKSKKTGLTSEQLVNVMTQILKKINPTKQTFKNKMYLSIKAQPSL
ncbi:general transcription factor IIF subunit 1 isoform X2 [Venturia canescens]|uniref:general transcription factor IIF subunit 1 isoform X2 n=1 Tax=Venturia canescens TaxID=32260 RepID=UPI001C9BEA9F|nr:general transcription factor IIF subunit 1 isoform X2 [Venturia canescens]